MLCIRNFFAKGASRQRGFKAEKENVKKRAFFYTSLKERKFLKGVAL